MHILMKKRVFGLGLGFVFLLSLVVACSQRAAQGGFDACPADSLTGEKVALSDSVWMRYPYRVRVSGSVAVVFDLNADSCFCHLFSYPDFRFIASFAPKGEGPEEVVSASMGRFIDKTHFGVLDMSGRKLLVYDDLNARSVPRLSQVIPFEESVSLPLEFLPLPDSTLLIPDYLGEARFCIADRSGRLLKKTGSITLADTVALRDNAPAVAQAWRSFLAIDEAGKRVVAVTQLGDVLDTYALQGEMAAEAHSIGPDGEPVFQVTPEGYGIPVGCMGYWDVQVTDSCIYTLYDGTKFKDIMQSPDGNRQGGALLRVFSREGKPLHSYQLGRQLSGIYVDEARRTLWAIDVNTDNGLYRYLLK